MEPYKRKPENTARHNRRRREENPGQIKAYLRAWNLKTKYGITIEEYDAKLLAQDGKCAICSDPPTATRKLAVDHDHATGAIRDLLCHVCNNFLGVFETRRAQFEAYLERHS